MGDFLLNLNNRLTVEFTHGQGAYLYDNAGNEYLDCLSGIGVTSLGHNHPAINQALVDQANKLWHLSNLFTIPAQQQLAKELSAASKLPQAKTFFCNSGSEAVETALKLARLYGRTKSSQNSKIIVMHKAFHGRTFGSLSANHQGTTESLFAPLLPGFIHVEFNDLPSLINLQKDPSIAAVLIEPIQGSGGINIATTQYLNNVREICTQQGWLMMLDEIQCGIGRSGKLFAYQYTQIQPDVLILAKALANGFPIGACIINEPYASLFTPGSHGSTFGGNPLACQVALATLHEIIANRWWDNAKIQGARLLSELRRRLSDNKIVREVRGLGLMLGIELNKPCHDILEYGLQHKIIFNIANKNTIRLLPPLIINTNQVTYMIDALTTVLSNYALK